MVDGEFFDRLNMPCSASTPYVISCAFKAISDKILSKTQYKKIDDRFIYFETDANVKETYDTH